MYVPPGSVSIKRLAALMAACIVLSACATSRPFRGADGKALPGSVAFMGKLKLGGYPQFVMARGRSSDNPALLYLHGGPGSAETPMLSYYNRALEDGFIVVNWDQRGAGKSFSPGIPEASMTVDRFVEDAHELVGWIKERYGKERIYLVGHSWGSILGTLLVQKYPQDFIAYVGLGQYVNAAGNERLSYAFTLAEAERLNDKKAIAELTRFAPPADGHYARFEDLATQRKWLVRFRGALWNIKDANARWVWAVLNTPEYADIKLGNVFKGPEWSVKLMEPELVKIDLSRTALDFKVPVYILAGRHDYNTPFELAKAYFDALSAPSKEFVWFEESAHSPQLEEPDLFNRTLERIKLETSGSGRP